MMNLRKNFLFGALALFLITAVTGAASAQEWVSNGSYSMKIKGYTEHTTFKDIPLIRVDKTLKKYLAKSEKGFKNGDFKLIIVDAAFRNDTDKHQSLGYSAWVTNDFYRTIYLRGEEGTEINPLENQGSYRPGWGGSIKNGITYYLKGGMPMGSKVAPGTVVSGKIAYFCPTWYVPTLGFTKIKAPVAGDSPELFGKTRLKHKVSKDTSVAAKPAPKSGKFCTGCGSKAEASHKFCSGCGAKL